MMTKPDQKTIGIAELMVRAGFLSDEDLHEALEIAKRTDQAQSRSQRSGAAQEWQS
jgi:hypothetical protein